METHRALQTQPGYALCLLHLVQPQSLSTTTNAHLAQAAAIAFKNAIRSGWSAPPLASSAAEDDHPTAPSAILSTQDRAYVKTNLLGCCTSSNLPTNVSVQLHESLCLIARADFPRAWPELLPQLVQLLSLQNQQPAESTIAALKVLHHLFARYRVEFKTEALWTEIKDVLASVVEPLWSLYVLLAKSVLQGQLPSGLIHWQPRQCIRALVIATELIHDLNAQDLAAEFEDADRMVQWFLATVLLLTVATATDEKHGPSSSSSSSPSSRFVETKEERETADERERPSAWDRLRTVICEAYVLFLFKYEEDCQNHVGACAQAVWTMLQQCSTNVCHDALVAAGLHVLSCVVKKVHFQSLFTAEGVLANMIEKIIMPQLQVRRSDLELFECNPHDYMRMDLDAGNVGTRKRACLELLHSLMHLFELQTSAIIKQAVQYLQGRPSWSDLQLSLLLEHTLVVRAGCLRTTLAFATDRLVPTLQRTMAAHATTTLATAAKAATPTSPATAATLMMPTTMAMQEVPKLLQADCLAMLSQWRLPSNGVRLPQLTQDDGRILPGIHLMLNTVAPFLQHVTEPVLQHYACHAIDRLMALVMACEHELPVQAGANLIPALLRLLATTTTTSSDFQRTFPTGNDACARALFRTTRAMGTTWCNTHRTLLVQHVSIVLRCLSAEASFTWQPTFLRFTFEWIASVVGLVKSGDVHVDSELQQCETLMESSLLCTLAAVSPLVVVGAEGPAPELRAYLLQVLALWIERRPPRPMGAEVLRNYLANPQYGQWDPSAGLVSATIRLVRACLFTTPSVDLVVGSTTNALFTAVQLLLRSRATELHGLELFHILLVRLPAESCRPYAPRLFSTNILPKLQHVRSGAGAGLLFVRRTLILLLCWMGTRGSQEVAQVLSSIQAQLDTTLLAQVLIPQMSALQLVLDQAFDGGHELPLPSFRQMGIGALTSWLQQHATTRQVDATWAMLFSVACTWMTSVPTTSTFVSTALEASLEAPTLLDEGGLDVTAVNASSSSSSSSQSNITRLSLAPIRTSPLTGEIACIWRNQLRTQLVQLWTVDVQTVLAKIPLPPGVHVAQLAKQLASIQTQ